MWRDAEPVGLAGRNAAAETSETRPIARRFDRVEKPAVHIARPAHWPGDVTAFRSQALLDLVFRISKLANQVVWSSDLGQFRMSLGVGAHFEPPGLNHAKRFPAHQALVRPLQWIFSHHPCYLERQRRNLPASKHRQGIPVKIPVTVVEGKVKPRAIQNRVSF